MPTGDFNKDAAQDALLKAAEELIGIASQDPLVTAIFFFGILAAAWAGATAGAPFSQRKEARAEVRRLSSKDPWLTAEAAAQLLYDELTSGRFQDGGQILQAMKGLSEFGNGIWGQVSGWVVDGINKGIIVAEGFRENRSQHEQIPQGIEAHDGLYMLRDAEGIAWKIDKVDRASIFEFLKDIENDNAA